MALDTRWKNPQGKTLDQLHLWAQETIRELRKGDFLSTISEADGIGYDNVASGLTADTVQEALDEIEDRVDDLEALPRGELIAIVEDQKTQNTAGQALATGSDQVRELNTLVFNRSTIASLASNQITLPAGTWEIAWNAPAVGGGGELHQSFLYNATDTAVVQRGESAAVASAATNDLSRSGGSTVVTIAGSKAFEIRHRVSGNISGGIAANFGTEVYTRVVVRRA